MSGGGEYTHEVWNWKGDSVSATSWCCWCVPKTYSVFSVERRNVDEDHQLVLLAPLRKFTGLWAGVARQRAQCPPVERLMPVDGEFVRLRVNQHDRMIVSTAKVGGYLSCNVPASVDEAIASAKQTTTTLTHHTVKAKLADGGVTDMSGSEVLLEYHRRGDPKVTRVDTADAVRGFQWVKTYQDFAPEKQSLVAFMNPIVHGAFAPDKCKNNDERMVQERVVKIRSKDQALTPFLDKVMKEFIDKFCEKAGVLEPVENEEVYARQNKPSQRRILEEAQHGHANGSAKVFQKAEAYPNVNDPRAITQINGVDKMDYSAFMYALSDVLKLFEWYAFGKKPSELAARVAQVCENAESHIDDTDFSRMDGRVGMLARYFERLLMMRLFPARYHVELLRLLKSQTGLNAKTTFGVQYSTGMARASGSAETSPFNTLLNAFVAFMGFRMSRRRGRFLNAEEAWAMLGVYGGDDGITADQDRKAAERAASLMGQVLTVERTVRGDMGVTFLARHYGPDVWFGDPNSCCDIKRQLAKFHTTARLPSNVTPLTKLREKSYAFSLTDAETPVIGPLVKRALFLHPMKKEEFKNELKIWNVVEGAAGQYPNTYSDWMLGLLMSQIPDFDLDLFNKWLQSTNRETILAPPLCAEPVEAKPKTGIVAVDGEFVHAKQEEVKPQTVAKSPAPVKHHRVRTKNAYKKAHAPAPTKKQSSRRSKPATPSDN